MEKLKKEVLQEIQNDPDLFAAVAKELNVKPYSLPTIIKRNGHSLNRYSVVALIASMMGADPRDLVSTENLIEP